MMLLSLMVIYLGAGVTIMRCCHTQEMTLATASDCCADDCGQGAKSCMTVEIHRLSPTVLAESPSVPLPLLVSAWLCAAQDVLPQAYTLYMPACDRYVPTRFVPPPRSYLSLLTQLVI